MPTEPQPPEKAKIVLENAKTVGDILRVMIKLHDLDSWKPGFIVRSTIISGIEKAIKTLKR